MAARSQAHEVKQHLDEVKSLRERLGTARWREEDWAIVDRVLESYEQLLSMLFEAQLTLTRSPASPPSIVPHNCAPLP